jgi:hypothetical protein
MFSRQFSTASALPSVQSTEAPKRLATNEQRPRPDDAKQNGAKGFASKKVGVVLHRQST